MMMAKDYEIAALGVSQETPTKLQLTKALAEFGRHRPDCQIGSGTATLDVDCDCGWNYWRTYLNSVRH